MHYFPHWLGQVLPLRLKSTQKRSTITWSNCASPQALPGSVSRSPSEERSSTRAALATRKLENLTPADGKTVHNVASVSKVMATVAVMQLVEKGLVGLDDAIQKYVPSFPKKRKPVTLRHILTHTSGIRHYKNGEFGPYGLREMRRFTDIEEAMQHFSEDPLLFEPGSYWMYSSHAFNLLQGVIEKASGLGFEEYMKRNVWEPAGMLASSFDVPERIVHKRGQGYVRNDEGILEHPRYADVSYKYAGGGMLTTVDDLVRLGIALNNGTLLEPETVKAMYTVQVVRRRFTISAEWRSGKTILPAGAGMEDRQRRPRSPLHQPHGHGQRNEVFYPELSRARSGSRSPGQHLAIRLEAAWLRPRTDVSSSGQRAVSRKQLTQAGWMKGLITSSPNSSKSRTFRVATARSFARAIDAI